MHRKINLEKHKNKNRAEIYWDSRYKENNAGWDLGSVSTPLKEYIDQISNKNLKVLIPGAGNAYEAEYMHLLGFKNVYVLDISKTAINNFTKRFPDFPEEYIICGDFFTHEGEYDLILEQTFFCAIDPTDRGKYSEKIYSLLKENGKLAGLLFNHVFDKEGPPYGGTADEYRTYFDGKFEYRIFETAYNSIKPRAGRELFINLVKKQILQS